MNKKIKISASIICANWMHLENDLKVLENEGVDYLHYDIMDGFFCPDYSLGSQIINAIREKTSIPADYHLMVEEPARMLNNFNVDKDSIMSIHYEACRNLHRDLIKIKKIGFKTGVILNPATPLQNIEYIIEEVDVICIMTVNPGYAGQKLVTQTLKKIEMLSEWRYKSNFNFEISVDGNVNGENIPKMIAAGTDILVAGSSGLFIAGMPLIESIKVFRNYISEGLKIIK